MLLFMAILGWLIAGPVLFCLALVYWGRLKDRHLPAAKAGYEVYKGHKSVAEITTATKSKMRNSAR